MMQFLALMMVLKRFIITGVHLCRIFTFTLGLTFLGKEVGQQLLSLIFFFRFPASVSFFDNLILLS